MVGVSAARVAAVSEPKPFKRKTSLDGLKPRDFDKNWPDGQVIEPPELEQRGLSEKQRYNIVMGVELLAELVRDANRYMKATQTTQQMLGSQCRLHENVVGDLLKGKRWPTWNTYGVVRTRVPTESDMDQFDFGDRVEKGFPTYRAELEERERRDRELKGRLERELRRRGPGRA
jgi:hypothetical protein